MANLDNFDNWDDDVEDGLGDAIEDKLKDEAEDLAKDGVKEAGKAIDKFTDRFAPIKNAKDAIKAKLSNNPITRLKASIKAFKDKIKQAAAKLAKEGIVAVGKAAVAGAKAFASFAAAHPIIALIIVVVIIVICISMGILDNIDSSSVNNNQNDITTSSNVLSTDNSSFDVSMMSTDDIIVTLMEDCVEQEYSGMSDMVGVEKEEQAKLLYSVFHSMGFNNVSIAGALANIDCESGLDSTAIEGIFSEYGILGSKKATAMTSLSAYTEHTLFPAYDEKARNDPDFSYSRSGYEATDDEGNVLYYCGIGLVQWTGPSAQMLTIAAETLGMNWYDMDFQISYMISDAFYRPGFFSEWVNNQEDDFSFDGSAYATDEEREAAYQEAYDAAVERAKKSAIYFMSRYEGIDTEAERARRSDAAETWYGIIFEWDDDTVDQGYVDNITQLAADLGAIVEFKKIEDSLYRCLSGNVFDNSSLATAAISLAWPTREQSYNNGTELYRTVLSTIWPTNYVYKACDRTVASAVRWSGTDDDFPIGNTNSQLAYMETSSKWEHVGAASSLTMDDLLPGDIFVLNGHTFMYVSSDFIQSAYAGEAALNSDTVSGSLNERSPGCDTSTTSIMNRNGADWEGRGIYQVFRCSTPDNSSTYKSIGSGINNHQ